jgi:hypothetical protein
VTAEPYFAERLDELEASPFRQNGAVPTALIVAPLDLATLLCGPPPKIDWLWQRWVARGDLVLFVAAAKTGKSLTGLCLADAHRRGASFLGADCAKGAAAIIDFENPLPDVHVRLRQRGLTAEDHAGLFYYHFPPVELTAPEGASWLQQMITDNALTLVVLDSFRRIAPGVDENDSAAVSAFFAPLRRITVATGCAIVVLHHPKKRQTDGPTEAGELVRGSGDFTAAVDTILFARKKPPDAFTLEAESRHGYPHAPVLVRISAPEAEKLELTNEGKVAVAEDKVEAMLARIVEALREDGGTLERQAVALRLGADAGSGTFTRALKLGWQREQLAKSPRKVGSATLYSLAEGLYE